MHQKGSNNSLCSCSDPDQAIHMILLQIFDRVRRYLPVLAARSATETDKHSYLSSSFSCQRIEEFWSEFLASALEYCFLMTFLNFSLYSPKNNIKWKVVNIQMKGASLNRIYFLFSFPLDHLNNSLWCTEIGKSGDVDQNSCSAAEIH